jgi:hypothetical protein
MTLMPRWRVLPNQQATWDDLVVQSAVGEWVLYTDMAKHYDVVLSIIMRAEKRAEVAEARLEAYKAQNVREF